MNYLILVNKQSKLVAIEAPEKPKYCYGWIPSQLCGAVRFSSKSCVCQQEFKKYNEALQSAIANESKHIRFRDEQIAFDLICNHLNISPPEILDLDELVGQTFQIPEGYRITTESVFGSGEIFAMLEKTSERVENSAHSFTEGSEEEFENEVLSKGFVSFPKHLQDKAKEVLSKPTAVAEPVKEVTQDQAHIALLLRISELKEENKRLKSELLDRDVNWLPAKDAEIERLEEELKDCNQAIDDNFQTAHRKIQSLEERLKVADSIINQSAPIWSSNSDRWDQYFELTNNYQSLKTK